MHELGGGGAVPVGARAVTWASSATRRRPRVRSCSFRTLRWLLVREVAARVLWPGQVLLRPGFSARWLVVTDTGTIRRAVARALRSRPSTRYVE